MCNAGDQKRYLLRAALSPVADLLKFQGSTGSSSVILTLRSREAKTPKEEITAISNPDSTNPICVRGEQAIDTYRGNEYRWEV